MSIEKPKEPVVANVYGTLRELSEDEKARRVAESREKMARDERSRLRGAKDEGRSDTQKEIAKKALLKGYDVHTISDLTGLDEQTINALR